MTPKAGNRYKREIEETVVMVGVVLPPGDYDSLTASMEELELLIDTLGGTIAATITQKRHSPDPGTFIGSGKIAELREKVEETCATLVTFDNELSGSQQKHLEADLNCRVIDRTGVILDIFSKHARTKEAKNQVEFAKLEYLLSHLTGRWTHLERQRGGIGMRGIGEKQIELDRRQIRDRMARLRKIIKRSENERSTQRKHRSRFLNVSIVGYTNAGKSTVMNNLTTAEVMVDDRLFATLDSTVRIIDPKTRPPILLSDTVGFIRKLPHSLVASFRSTLAEVIDADLLLHVVDLSANNYLEQLEVTQQVLEEIGAGEKPTLMVFNKVDAVEEFYLPKLMERRYIDSVMVSALREKDMKRLREAIYAYFEKDMLELEVVVPYSNTLLQSQIHEYSKVLDKKYLEEGTRMKIRIMRTDADWLKLTQKSS